MSEENKKTQVDAEVVETKSDEHAHKHNSHKNTDSSAKNESKDTSEGENAFNFTTFTDTLDKFFNKQLPSLPKNIKELIVQILPYLFIIGLVLYAISLIFILISLPFLLLAGAFGSVISLIFSFGTVILSALSIPYLLKKEKKGWTYNYYAFLIGLLGNLLAGSLFGVVFGGFIGGYFLFQIKSYYK